MRYKKHPFIKDNSRKSKGGFHSQSMKTQKFMTIDERIKYYNYVQNHLKHIPKKIMSDLKNI